MWDWHPNAFPPSLLHWCPSNLCSSTNKTSSINLTYSVPLTLLLHVLMSLDTIMIASKTFLKRLVIIDCFGLNFFFFFKKLKPTSWLKYYCNSLRQKNHNSTPYNRFKNKLMKCNVKCHKRLECASLITNLFKIRSSITHNPTNGIKTKIMNSSNKSFIKREEFFKGTTIQQMVLAKLNFSTHGAWQGVPHRTFSNDLISLFWAILEKAKLHIKILSICFELKTISW